MIFLDLDYPTTAIGDNGDCRDASPRFEAITFPGGEEHVKLRRFEGWPRDTPVTIVARLRSSGDIQRMLLMADACRRRDWRVYGFIPYVPYARQDRVMVPGESFSLKVFLKQLKLAEFEKVAFFDPHSDVVAAMTDALEIKSLIITNESHVKQQATLLGSGEAELVIVAPDAGAAKKMAKLHLSHRVVVGNKTRNLHTGHITSYTFSGDVRGCRCLVVDDICDGGATFELLARALTDGGAVAKHLFVSHGIFSKGLDSLKAHYATIATTNSFWRELHTSPPHVYRLPFDVF